MAQDLGTDLLRLEKKLVSTPSDSLKVFVCYEKVDLLTSYHEYQQLDFELQRLIKLGGFLPTYKPLYSLLLQTFYQEKKYSLVYRFFEQTRMSLQDETDKTLWYYYLSSLMHEEEFTKLKTVRDELYLKQGIKAPNSLDSLQEFIEKNYGYARLMQSIVPGSGLIALGYYKKGITNLILNGGFGWFTGHYIAMRLISPAIVFGLYPFGKFYFGSQRHLSYLIDQKNLSNKKDTFEKNDLKIYRFCKGMVY